MKPLLKIALLIAIAAVPLCAIAAFAFATITAEAVCSLLSFTAIGIGMAYAVKDNDTAVYDAAAALPNGAASANSQIFDLGIGAKGDCPGDFEIEVSAPALGVTPMSNGKYMYYDIYHDTAAAMGSEVFLLRIGSQLGAGGVGCAAATFRSRLPNDTNRYIRVKATGSDAGDASGSDMAVRLVF